MSGTEATACNSYAATVPAGGAPAPESGLRIRTTYTVRDTTNDVSTPSSYRLRRICERRFSS